MPQGYNSSKPAYQDALQSAPVRTNLNSLATCHRGATAPTDPDDGWLWLDTADVTNYKLKMYLTGAWIIILNNLQGGFPTQSGASLVIHNQTVASASWSIVHNLNTLNPILVFYDSLTAPKNQIVPSNVEVTTVDTVTVTFSAAIAGTATVLG